MRSFCIDWAPFGKKSLSVIRNSGVVAVQCVFFYCGNGDAIGTSVSVCYIVDVRSSGVVVKRDSTVYVQCNSDAVEHYILSWYSHSSLAPSHQ